MTTRNKVLVIATGGTIVSPQKGGAAAPDGRYADMLLGKAREYFDAEGVRVKVISPFGEAGIDSSDMGPLQWVRLASEIYRARSPELRGVLITHGTDTMAYTASWLSVCFSHEEFPIILTGSQQSPDDQPFDGEINLLGAARLVRECKRGVWIYFNWKLFEARRAHKKNCEAIDAYGSIGGPALTYHDALKGYADFPMPGGAEGVPASFAEVLALPEETILAATRKVAVCFAFPGAFPRLGGDEEVLIAVGYGAGNIPSSYLRALEEKYRGGRKPCIIACSQAEEGQKKPDAYKDVGIGELAGRGFTVFNSGTFTLEYMTALAYYAVLSSKEPSGVLSKYLCKL